MQKRVEMHYKKHENAEFILNVLQIKVHYVHLSVRPHVNSLRSLKLLKPNSEILFPITHGIRLV